MAPDGPPPAAVASPPVLLLAAKVELMSFFSRKPRPEPDEPHHEETPMSDRRYTDDAPHRAPGDPDGPADLPDSGYAHDEPTDDEPITERILFEDLTADQPPERDRCPACRGTGYKMTTSDFLRESIGLIDGQEDAVIRQFYENLMDFAPHLVKAFPADLLDPQSPAGTPEGGKTGRRQRDLLVGALVALATLYDPYAPDKMEQLRTALAAFGRSHSNFAALGRGANLDEYHAVKVVLFTTLHDAAGGAWLPVYDEAWSEAYDFAAAHMLVAQFDAPQRFARMPRREH